MTPGAATHGGLRARALTLVALGIGAVCCLKRPYCFDLWWHLAAGRWMVEHARVIRHDPFSFTAQGQEWVDVSWLFQLILYGLHRGLGWWGVAALKLALGTGTLLVLWRHLRARGGLEVCWATCLLGLWAMEGRLMARPHLCAYLLLCWQLWALERYLRGGGLRWLVGLVGAEALWANLHGSFPLGIALVACCGLLERRPPLLGCALACVLATLLNPYGERAWGVALFSHTVGAAPEALEHIREWAPLHPLRLLDLRPNALLPFKLLLWSSVAGLLAIGRRAARRWELVLPLGFGALSLQHVRFASLGGLALCPVACACLSALAERRRWARASALLVGMALAVGLAWRLSRTPLGPQPRWSVYPRATVSFLQQRGLRGRVFNQYAFGGYIIWHLYPRVKVFIDGRTPTLHPSERLWVHQAVLRRPEAFARLAQRWDIDLVLVRPETALARALEEDPRWHLLAFDDVSALWSRQDLPGSYRHLRVCGDLRGLLGDGRRRLDEIERELRRAAREQPSFLAYNLLGTLLGEGRHDFRGALAAFRRAAALRPRSPVVHYNMALALQRLGRLEEALEEIWKALRWGRDPAYLKRAGIICYQLGRWRAAVRYLERYRRRVRDRASPLVYERLGIAWLRLGQPLRARRFLKRVLLLSPEPHRQALTWYNLGNVEFALGRWSEAIDCYRRALALEPDLREARHNLQKARQRLAAGGD